MSGEELKLLTLWSWCCSCPQLIWLILLMCGIQSINVGNRLAQIPQSPPLHQAINPQALDVMVKFDLRLRYYRSLTPNTASMSPRGFLPLRTATKTPS